MESQDPTLQAPPTEQKSAPPSTDDKRARAQALSDELAQAQASLEQNLSQELAALCENTDLEDLFYEDKEAFFKKVFELQNQKIQAEYGDKTKELETLTNEIALDDGVQAIEQARQAYEQAHPGADTQALLEFFMQLPKEQQEQIESLPPEQVFETLATMQGGQSAQGELPQQVSGVPSPASVNAPEYDLPMQRY